MATIYSLTSLISITPVHAESYSASLNKTGLKAYHSFIIEDRFSGTTIGPGMILESMVKKLIALNQWFKSLLVLFMHTKK